MPPEYKADKIFSEEEAHLTELLLRLDQEIQRCTADADKKTEEANSLWTLDADDREAKRTLRRQGNELRERAEALGRVRNDPYFRRLDTISTGPDGTSYYETIYVGKRDVRVGQETLIYHPWSDRVSLLVDNVHAKIGDEDVTVELKRRFQIKSGTLQSYVDEYVRDPNKPRPEGISDPYLLEILRDNRRQHAPAHIIRSIQSEQMKIVRFPQKKSFIVQGCAGSGKTMILLHRLSYLIYHDHDRDWSRTRILTSNPAFSDHVADLCKELEIEEVPRSSYEEYLADLICRYRGRAFAIGQLRSEENLVPEFLSRIYSEEFADQLHASVTAWWDERIRLLHASGLIGLAERLQIQFSDPQDSFGESTTQSWDSIYGLVRKKLSEAELKIDTAEKDLGKALKDAAWAERTLERAEKRIEKSAEDIREWINEMRADIDEAYSVWNAAAPLGTQVRSAADLYTDVGSGKTVPNVIFQILGSVPGADCLGEYAEDVKKRDQEREKREEKIERVASLTRRLENLKAHRPSKETYSILECAAELIGQLTENGLMKGPVSDAVSKARRGLKTSRDGYNGKSTALYRHQMYLRLLLCTWYYRRPPVSAREKALYIDEAQDYAPAEILLLRSVTGAVPYNLFGDLQQRTNPGRGISDWTELNSVTRNFFQLRQNYRNTSQIAEFCNKKTGLFVQPIGIEGPPVRETSVADGIEWVVRRHKEEPALRAAVIVSSLPQEVQTLLDLAVERGELRWGSEKEAISENSVPILTIQESKGLEYELVLAITDSDQESSSYVAYTRAISELTVADLGEVSKQAETAEGFDASQENADRAEDVETASGISSADEHAAEAAAPAPAEPRHVLVGREHKISEVFTDEYQFRIPNYQRPYAWKQEQAVQLLDDLRQAHELDTPEYFLGSLVVIRKDNNPETDVIDGQQRLTTLSILAAAVAHQSDGPLRKKAMGLVVSSDENGGHARVRLRERDQSFFEEYIASCDFAGLDKLVADTLPEAQANMYAVARYFRSVLEQMDPEEIDSLFAYILTQCSLIIVSTPDDKSAFRIFSVLNNRGMDLQGSDILKARLIGGLPENQQEEYSRRWEEMEARLGREAFGQFFDQIILSDPRCPTKKSATEFIIDRITTIKPVLSAKDFIDVIMIPKYAALTTLLEANYEDTMYGPRTNQSLRWLNLLTGRDWIPPAIVWMQRYGEDGPGTADFFRRLERLVTFIALQGADFRRDKRIKRYRSITTDLDQGHEPVDLELTAAEKAKFCEMLDGDIGKQANSRTAKYILMHLEAALCAARKTPFVWSSVFEVERILPEKLLSDSRWARDWTVKEHEQWKNRLANLVPLAGKIPLKRRGDDFDRKKVRYFHKGNSAGFSIPVTVQKLREWVPEVARIRQKELMAVLAEHWDLQ